VAVGVGDGVGADGGWGVVMSLVGFCLVRILVNLNPKSKSKQQTTKN
jgi:hypothetical protein